MSLTNPKNVITEERLAEFYQGILPYLGGMPDVLANKFNKSDLYSEDEKIIGRWIDGKPIYQKVIPFTGSGRTATIGTLTNIDLVVELKGIVIEGSSIVNVNNYNSRLYYNNSTGVLQFQGNTSWNSFTAYATIQYTKTTDSPVEIGIDTDYSTTEKIVGTWIDGKPLYQKTFTGTITTSNDSYVALGTLGTGVDVINYFGYYKKGGATFSLNTPNPSNNTNSRSALIYSDGVTINAKIGTGSAGTYDYAVTVQYTKTTD